MNYDRGNLAKVGEIQFANEGKTFGMRVSRKFASRCSSVCLVKGSFGLFQCGFVEMGSIGMRN
jgi:hypothetical protein